MLASDLFELYTDSVTEGFIQLERNRRNDLSPGLLYNMLKPYSDYPEVRAEMFELRKHFKTQPRPTRREASIRTPRDTRPLNKRP